MPDEFSLQMWEAPPRQQRSWGLALAESSKYGNKSSLLLWGQWVDVVLVSRGRCGASIHGMFMCSRLPQYWWSWEADTDTIPHELQAWGNLGFLFYSQHKWKEFVPFPNSHEQVKEKWKIFSSKAHSLWVWEQQPGSPAVLGKPS